MQRLTALILGIAIAAQPATAEQKPPYIFQIVDDFMTSNAVASKCTKPDAEKMSKFLVNFDIVTRVASVEMKKLRPDATSEQVEKTMQDRYQQIDKGVSDIIHQETCDGPRIHEILRLFDVQAGMDLLGGSSTN
jgi:hypothetical protein